MKNVKMDRIVEIKEMVEKLKHCKALYRHALEAFDPNKDFYEGNEIRTAIKNLAYDTLHDIDYILGDTYEVWSGKSKLRVQEFASNDAYYAAKDLFDEQYEEKGSCQYLIGFKGMDDNDVEVRMCFLPVVFMEEFIQEYGIFTLNNETLDVGIV